MPSVQHRQLQLHWWGEGNLPSLSVNPRREVFLFSLFNKRDIHCDIGILWLFSYLSYLYLICLHFFHELPIVYFYMFAYSVSNNSGYEFCMRLTFWFFKWKCDNIPLLETRELLQIKQEEGDCELGAYICNPRMESCLTHEVFVYIYFFKSQRNCSDLAWPFRWCF